MLLSEFFFFPVIDAAGDHHAQVIMQHHPVEQVRYAVIRSRLQRIRWTFMLIFLCPIWTFLSHELDTVEHHAQVIMQHHSVVSKQVDITGWGLFGCSWKWSDDGDVTTDMANREFLSGRNSAWTELTSETHAQFQAWMGQCQGWKPAISVEV